MPSNQKPLLMIAHRSPVPCFKLRFIGAWTSLCIMSLVLVGCDNGDSSPDLDIEGTWRIQTLADSSGDLTEVLNQAFHTVTFQFAGDEAFTWFQDGVDDQDDETLLGSYTLSAESDETGTVRVTLNEGTFSFQLIFSLMRLSASEIRMMTSAEEGNEVFNSNFQGTISITLNRV